MASENDSQEKTEDPTQKRIEKALEDGQVLSSKELFVFATSLAGLFVYIVAVNSSDLMLGQWGAFFQFELGEFTGEATRLGYEALIYVLLYGLAVGIPLFIIVIFTQGVLAGQINFASKGMAFKPDKLDPIKGIKRMFSLKSLVELLKSILKVVALVGVAGFVGYSFLINLMTVAHVNLVGALKRFNDVFITLFICLLIVLAIIALIDVIWQRYQYIQQLRMSKQDVKDEQKQTEGSPEVKAKIRRMQMSNAATAAQQRAALEDVATATAIITNPTHFAVALKYEVGARGAPIIVAMGRGKMANDIIDIAQTEAVPIFQSPLLARALFFTGQIGDEIHEALFSAVAAVLAFILRVANGEALQAPDIEVPDELQFTETGSRYNA